MPAEPLAILSLKTRGDMKYVASRPASAEEEAGKANRLSFLASLGLEPGRILGAELHHSRRVALVLPDGAEEIFGPGPGPGIPAGARDGLILAPEAPPGTGRLPPGGWGASVTVADCMPIWILDRASGAYGVLHSGWKGTGILAVAVEALGRRLGSEPSSISVILGPSIGSCCYSVTEERAAGFAAEFGEKSVRRCEGLFFLDLLAANLGLADSLGIGAVLAVEACTACDSGFGSSRRESAEAIARLGRASAAHGDALGQPSFTRMLALCCTPPGGFLP